MTINLTDPVNHPANGLLPVPRIERVIEVLKHSLQYENGGDMAYVIADAIKGLEELLVSREAEPVAWTEKCEITNMQATWLYLRGFPNNSQGRDIPLYTAPPASVIEDGWIPVSERMPEREVDVQVYCSDKKEQMVGYMERNEKDGWFRFASLPNGGGVYCKPTHWQPLPAAPKEVK